MRRTIAIVLLAAGASQAQAAGILIPTEKEVPPLAMLNHVVNIKVDDQVSVTRVEQTFRNHTDRQLEATYVFPVPKGASVRNFTMWVDGKKVRGELVEAKKARRIYNSIVQRTMDPGLLEYVGHRMFKLRVFPVPANGDQKIAFSFVSVLPKENGLVHCTYPLKTTGKAIKTLEKFSINVSLKSQHSIQNVYSPTHAIRVKRSNDKNATVSFTENEAELNRNFDLYYTAGGKDVGLTTIMHRPSESQKGWFLMLVSPRAELSKEQQAPRDIVFVLDTSGSMRGKRINQAKKALNYCLSELNKQDRFAIIQFATTINRYSNNWLDADGDNTAPAQKWVSGLYATGGTAINDALTAALKMRSDDKSRTFTVVFFTDGRPTIGETDSDVILKGVLKKNNTNTRIFTFGVGNDVNATMLDQLAEESRAVSTYVREAEDITEKVSALYGKISHPVLTNLNLEVTNGVRVTEMYPPKLPDLFHGSQLVVLGRYEGDGGAAVKLAGNVGKDKRQFVYETNFIKKSTEEKPFVEDLWARRKVGYLLDQIRRNGEQKELVEEVVALSKRYGITTPYTSYLIVPDGPATVAEKTPVFRQRDLPRVAFPAPPAGAGGGDKGGSAKGKRPPAFVPTDGKTKVSIADYAKRIKKEGGLATNRGRIEDYRYGAFVPTSPGKTRKDADALRRWSEAKDKKNAYDRARTYFGRADLERVRGGRLGVDLSVWNNSLRNQSRVTRSAVYRVNSRNVIEVGGVWIDENFDAKMKAVTVKAMSNAYFKLLKRRPELKKVFQVGNHLVWVTPSGKALVIDTQDGLTDITDAQINALFAAKKKS